MYLPKRVVKAANELFAECTFLSNKPTMEKTERCIDRLFSFQNVIRTCAGVDAISKDLLQAFGAVEKSGSKSSKG